MKKRSIVLLLFYLVMMSNTLHAGDVLDAHTWAGWEYEEKRKFVLGFIEGQRVTSEEVEPLIDQIADENLKDLIKEQLNSLSFTSYAVKVVDGVEAYYMKSKNLKATIGDACAAVIRKM